MPSRRRDRRGERGQSTAFVVTLLMVLVFFVSMVVNVGQAVNRRIALQIVADAGAFTGGTRMAEGLNYIAFANGVIQDWWAMTTDAWAVASLIPPPGTCSAFDAINSAYKGIYQVYNVPIQIINYTYSNIPYTEAKRVSTYNIRDMFPDESTSKFSFKEAKLSPDVGMILPSRDLINLMSLQEVSDGTDPETSYPAVFPLGPGATSNHTQPCWTTCGIFPCVLPESWSFPLWYKKSSTSTKYFVWLVKAPKTKGLMFDRYFGVDLIPEMWAVAVSRPVGGNIQKGDARYTVQMMPAKSVMAAGGMIRDEHYDRFGGFRMVVH
jgi:hypothetical protein